LIGKNYLKGRYGAVPVIRAIPPVGQTHPAESEPPGHSPER
jgi:hypothetical protein